MLKSFLKECIDQRERRKKEALSPNTEVGRMLKVLLVTIDKKERNSFSDCKN